jgi:hypothetical protein
MVIPKYPTNPSRIGITGTPTQELKPATFPKYASIPRWMDISGMGRSMSYEWLGDGRLRGKKLGSKTIIDVEFGLAQIAALPDCEIRSHGRRRSDNSDGSATSKSPARLDDRPVA